ncbi:TolC family protein [Mucilaginibacter sp. UR6-11]|uniref:TolC family protein n=1 Tax=Mucilaginibacter sp. UR6-11 TaxID=1435644 RepID=UPI001E4A2E28|nr:TolC family protein [Mucilaginibacter sp. UR6-11]MCC8424889.1 TolC family protein [Mucilaginibacter sp. UR6-11]
MYKMLKRFLIVVVILLGNTALYAQQLVTDSVLTLQQCLDIGVKNNLLVKQTEAQMEASRVYWQQARENLLPSINGTINHSISEGRSLNPFTNGYLNQPITSANYNLAGSIILSSGLTLHNSIRQTALAYQAGQMDFEQAKNDLTLNLIIAYLQVLSSEDQLTQAATQALVSQKQEERTEVLNKDGAVPPSQLYDLKGQLATDQIGAINAQNSLEIAKLNLLQLMNVNYRKNIKFQRQAIDSRTATYNQTADQVYESSLANFALIKAGTLRRQSAEKNLQVAKGYLLPTLSLSGGLSTNYSSAAQRSIFVDSTVVPTSQFIQTSSGRQTVYTMQQNYASQNISYGDQFRNNYGTTVSLGLNIPILNYFQNRNKITLAKLNLQTQRYNEQANQVQLKVNVDQAYVNMTSAYERYQLLNNQVEAYTESFRIAEIRFNAGALTSVDFIIVKGNLDKAKTNLINARYDYLVRTKILDYYQGKLAL